MSAAQGKARLREHLPETVWKAQELYCVARLSFREVAHETGVAESTLKRWSEKHDWRNKRDTIARAECDIRADLVLARSEMIKALITTKDAQKGFAVASLETLAMRQAEAQRIGKALESATRNEKRIIRTTEEAAQALREAIETKLSMLLAAPEDIDFKAVADVQKALKLVGEMEAAAKPAEDGTKTKGLSADLEARIREII